jgi:sterol desaturase/sphingolipid hydroxylase (fatty acid hydroxylase superfamily)
VNISLEDAQPLMPQAQGQYSADASSSRASQQAYPLVRRLLAADPFLLYLDESSEVYHVRHSEGELRVLKERGIPEPYPARRPLWLQRAYRWLWLACLGLLLAGLGAMVFATLAAAAALALNSQPISRSDRIRSLVVLLLAGGLWLGGLLLAVILLVHLI